GFAREASASGRIDKPLEFIVAVTHRDLPSKKAVRWRTRLAIEISRHDHGAAARLMPDECGELAHLALPDPLLGGPDPGVEVGIENIDLPDLGNQHSRVKRTFAREAVRSRRAAEAMRCS